MAKPMVLVMVLLYTMSCCALPRGHELSERDELHEVTENDATEKTSQPLQSSGAQDTKDLSVMDLITRINQKKHLNLLFEGDINLLDLKFTKATAMSKTKREFENVISSDLRKRDTKRDWRFLWRRRVIPYVISDDLVEQTSLIERAMQHIQSESCVKFKKRTNEKNWIFIVKKEGCWSSIGKVYWREGPQEISLGEECYIIGTVVHELLHSLGFWHEQSRPDRDKYIEIFWENIQEGQEFNFEKYNIGESNTLGIQYDSTSVMHYGKHSFSKNNKPTVLALGNPDKKLGQLNGLSALDVVQLNALYDCAGAAAGNHWSTWSVYGPCSEYCYKQRQRFCASDDLKHCVGANEYGVQSQFAKCKQDATECYAPINGHWGRWSRWSQCSKSCGDGTHFRKRVCNDPAPKYGGKACSGKQNETGACNAGSCYLGKYDCEFESSVNQFCEWTNMRSNPRFNWFIKKGATPSGGTGPSGDHTTGKGHYAFVEGSKPAAPGDKAHLFSSVIEGTGEKCLTFYYHMYGTSMGSLRIYLQLIKKEEITGIWARTGNQGTTWRKGQFLIQYEPPYRIIFEAERGPGYQSDIALDDIHLRSGPCDPSNPSTLPASMIPKIIAPERVGCFNDKGDIAGRRPFPTYKDLRNSIDWANIDKIVQDCAKLAKSKGAQFFAIQFYGECWYGNSQEVNYDRDGTSKDCWKAVGKANTMMVYKLKT